MKKTNTKKHSDIKDNSWVEKHLVQEIRPYAYLMRLDRPIGTWLLLLPGWWAIVLAAGGGSGINGSIFYILWLFAIGAVVMRGAGCIINDLWDREFDKQVERTEKRPLAAGTLSVKKAVAILCLLLFVGFCVLCQLTLVPLLLGLMVFPLIVLYPLMKRWTWWPQLFLGITFNFGALIGWTAVNDVVSPEALLLYCGGIFWTLGYDTIYAHQDKEDDARIGLKSTALRFGDNSKNYVTIFYVMAMFLFTLAFALAGAGPLSFVMLALAALHLAGQVKVWDMNDKENSLDMFKSNQAFGMFICLAAIFY